MFVQAIALVCSTRLGRDVVPLGVNDTLEDRLSLALNAQVDRGETTAVVVTALRHAMARDERRQSRESDESGRE